MKCAHWAHDAYEGLDFGKCPKNERLMQMVDLASKPQDWRELESFASSCDTCAKNLNTREKENTAILSSIPEPYINAEDLLSLQGEIHGVVDSIVKMRKLNLGSDEDEGVVSKLKKLLHI